MGIGSDGELDSKALAAIRGVRNLGIQRFLEGALLEPANRIVDRIARDLESEGLLHGREKKQGKADQPHNRYQKVRDELRRLWARDIRKAYSLQRLKYRNPLLIPDKGSGLSEEKRNHRQRELKDRFERRMNGLAAKYFHDTKYKIERENHKKERQKRHSRGRSKTVRAMYVITSHQLGKGAEYSTGIEEEIHGADSHSFSALYRVVAEKASIKDSIDKRVRSQEEKRTIRRERRIAYQKAQRSESYASANVDEPAPQTQRSKYRGKARAGHFNFNKKKRGPMDRRYVNKPQYKR